MTTTQPVKVSHAKPYLLRTGKPQWHPNERDAIENIDAPDIMPAGSTWNIDNYGEILPATRSFVRDGYKPREEHQTKKKEIKNMQNVFDIPMELIDVEPQVRTTFSEKSITELAESIKKHGLLQPLVVQVRGNRYVLKIGERRLKALRYLDTDFAPACISTLSEDQGREAQLIENIQREDLNVKDLAAAVLMMYDQYGSSRVVAERCNKSKSWVSKRLQLAKNIGPLTVELMDTVTDIELLYTFAKLETTDKDSARLIANDIKKGIAGRAEVNATLAKALNPDNDDDDQEQSELDGIDTEQPERTGEANADLAYRLKIAMDALGEIEETKVAGTQSKAMRKIASAALARLETV